MHGTDKLPSFETRPAAAPQDEAGGGRRPKCHPQSHGAQRHVQFVAAAVVPGSKMYLAAQLAPRRSHPAPARAACRPRNTFPVEIFRHGAIMPRPRPAVKAPSERRAPPSPHRSSRWGEGWGEGQAPAPTVRANFFSGAASAMLQGPHAPLPLTLPSPHGVKNAAGRGNARTLRGRAERRRRVGKIAVGPDTLNRRARRFCPPYGALDRTSVSANSPTGSSVRPSRLRSRKPVRRSASSAMRS